MKKELLEYEKKSTEQVATIEAMTTKYQKLTDEYFQLKEDASRKEIEWRKKIAQLESVDQELQNKSRSSAKTDKPKSDGPTQNVSIVKIFHEQKMQRIELEWRKKTSELEMRLHESREQFLRDKIKLEKELEIKLRKKWEVEFREKKKNEIQSTDENPTQRKRPYRECRKRVLTYKE